MICKKCAHEKYCNMARFGARFGGHVPPITACSKFKAKSQTNADRIRTMTDEKLANYIWQLQNTKERRSTNGWLDWLKQEVESNG